jgi:hypothetical protein
LDRQNEMDHPADHLPATTTEAMDVTATIEEDTMTAMKDAAVATTTMIDMNAPATTTAMHQAVEATAVEMITAMNLAVRKFERTKTQV